MPSFDYYMVTACPMTYLPVYAAYTLRFRNATKYMYIGFTSFLQQVGGGIPQEPKWGTGCDSCQN
jgi:hypothetical protein